MNKTAERGISDIVGCLTDPIIVFSGGWGDTIPDWLKGAITMERMIGNLKPIKGAQLTGTDAEACAYLMTVSLTQPMDSDWTQIYLYVAGQTYKRWNKGEMPADIIVDSICDSQVRELERLKAWLYRQRVRARTERDKTERRESREEAEAQREAEQPARYSSSEMDHLSWKGRGQIPALFLANLPMFRYSPLVYNDILLYRVSLGNCGF